MTVQVVASTPAGNVDRPRTLEFDDAIKSRMAMIELPHMAPLTRYVDVLRSRASGAEFPYFDPLDGGVEADILFLFEKPGPKTSVKRGGSGFISRNNNDPTAESTFQFMQQANLPRKRTVIWNVIAGWNDTIAIDRLERLRGMEELHNLLPLLPTLKTVVLVGRRAQAARPLLDASRLRILESVHPSPKVRATQRAQWDAIPEIWARAAFSGSAAF